MKKYIFSSFQNIKPKITKNFCDVAEFRSIYQSNKKIMNHNNIFDMFLFLLAFLYQVQIIIFLEYYLS